MITMQNMTWQDWVNVPTNPRQRNTERRARVAVHLHTPHQVHQLVQAAVFPDGSLMKLDGHTRAFLWEKGVVTPPENVQVLMHLAENPTEAMDLYSKFDSMEARETASDRVFGAYRQYGLEFKSGLLKDSRIAKALTMATLSSGVGPFYPKLDTYNMVLLWKEELLLLDALGIGRNGLIRQLSGVALLSLARYPNDPLVNEFWKRVAVGAGWKSAKSSTVPGGKMVVLRDAVEALDHGIYSEKGQLAKDKEVISKAVSAVEAFREGKIYEGGVKTTDVKKWFEKTADKILARYMAYTDSKA